MMKDLKRILMAVAMMGIVSAGVFAQKNSNDNKQRPPKADPPKVVVKDKDNKPTPPPSNTNKKP